MSFLGEILVRDEFLRFNEVEEEGEECKFFTVIS